MACFNTINMQLSENTIKQSENNFKKIRDSKGYVKAYIVYNINYKEDIIYAFEKLGVVTSPFKTEAINHFKDKWFSAIVSKKTIYFPYNKFKDLIKVVGIMNLDVVNINNDTSPIYIKQPVESPRGETNKSKKNKTKNKMEKYMNIKTIAGVGIGVAIGHFAVKSSNPLVLIAFGIGGGILANMIKTESEKRAEEEKKMLENVSREIENSLGEDSSDMEGVSFNPTVGYFTPYGTVEETSPSNYMDVSF